MDVLPWLYVVLVTCLPWIELRGSIPLGVLGLGLNPVLVFLVAGLVNVAVIYPAFWFLDWFFDFMMRIPVFGRVLARTQAKARPYVEKYGEVGLVLFVGVPLPGTGAYSGSLAAHVLGIKNRRAASSIALGVLLAAVVITLASTVFRESLGWFLNKQLL
ncbi:MAG: small multidrug export protein [Candidatus Altiarchaeales archaeon]|nr:small multidrug export protein [Candidatus Altiarchaeales archaeon]